MTQRTEQRTFYGSDCEEKALEWLCNMEKCFNLIKISWKKYKIKLWHGLESRCKVVLNYK